MLAITIPEGHTETSPAPPNSLLSKELPTPVPSVDQALIRVHAAAISPLELSWANTYQYPGVRIPVHDVAGVVVSAPDSSNLTVGTEVFGLLRFAGNGALAEYVVADVDVLARLPAPPGEPEALRFVRAASIPRAALTAWQTLVTKGKLKKGENILITGATGAVGRMGVQIARWVLGKTGKITATGGKGVEQLNDLGADAAISYRAESDWESTVAMGGKVDFVFDCVGGETLEKCLPLVKDGGRVFTVSSNPIPEWEKVSGWKDAVERAVEMVFFIVEGSGEQLAEIAELVERGTIRTSVSVVVHGLSEEGVRDGWARALKGGISGSVVVNVTGD